jgi:hypothetical protein
MNHLKTSTWWTAVAFLASGCAATESPSFRSMSAAEHERLASAGADGASPAQHLEASHDLREAERLACAEIPAAERDQGPFARRDRVVGAKELRARFYPKAPLQTAGVAIELRATPDTTEQWLGRVIQCHLAHYAVVGAATADPADPLMIAGTQVAVSSTQTGFRVAITSSSLESAKEALQRGMYLSDKGS